MITGRMVQIGPKLHFLPSYRGYGCRLPRLNPVQDILSIFVPLLTSVWLFLATWQKKPMRRFALCERVSRMRDFGSNRHLWDDSKVNMFHVPLCHDRCLCQITNLPAGIWAVACLNVTRKAIGFPMTKDWIGSNVKMIPQRTASYSYVDSYNTDYFFGLAQRGANIEQMLGPLIKGMGYFICFLLQGA